MPASRPTCCSSNFFVPVFGQLHVSTFLQQQPVRFVRLATASITLVGDAAGN